MKTTSVLLAAAIFVMSGQAFSTFPGGCLGEEYMGAKFEDGAYGQTVVGTCTNNAAAFVSRTCNKSGWSWKVVGSCAPATCPGYNNAANILFTHALTMIAQENLLGGTEGCAGAGKGEPGIFSPVGVARAYYAVAHAMYNSWAVYDAMATPRVPYADMPNLPSTERIEANKVTAIAHAAYQMCKYLLPNGVTRYGLAAKILSDLGVDVTVTNYVNSTPQGIAIAMTERFIDILKVDASNQANCYKEYTNFKPANPPTNLASNATIDATQILNEFLWSPIMKPYFQDAPVPFLTPWAAFMTPFATGKTFFAPPMPDDATLREQMLEVGHIQANISDDDGYHMMIAELWADGPKSTLPPGHWQEITMTVQKRSCLPTVDQSIQMIFLSSAATFDAGIWTWVNKRLYNSVRVGTWIPKFASTTTFQNAWTGQNCPFGDVAGYQWTPYQAEKFVTPPFASYPSGHSTFSAATATVLSLYYGSQFIPGGSISYDILPGRSLFMPYCSAAGKTLQGASCTFRSCYFDSTYNSENVYYPKNTVTLGPFHTFYDMADQAGISRLYGGIHIHADDLEGRVLGRQVGTYVFDIGMKYIQGLIK